MKRLALIIFMLFTLVNGAYARHGSSLGHCGSNSSNWMTCSPSGSGSEYYGDKKDGKPNGYGLLITNYGIRYIGEYRDGYKHGQGTAINRSGKVLRQGIWKWGVYQSQATLQETLLERGNQKRIREFITTQQKVLRSEFNKRTLAQRKHIQLVLKQNIYYFGAIDGIWGAKTTNALIEYVLSGKIHTSLDDRYPSYWFDFLLTTILKTETILTTKTTSGSSSTPKWLLKITNENLCLSVGSVPNLWNKIYVDEAKRRGLSCAVGNQTAQLIPKKTCNDDPTLCTVSKLCSKATKVFGEKKTWNTASDALKYVEEAKKNGVPCGVKAESKKVEEMVRIASGSGFYISKAGHLITNDHVINICQKVQVESSGGTLIAKVLQYDEINDLALLKTSSYPGIAFPISTEPLYLAQPVRAAGYPKINLLGRVLKVTGGMVSALSGRSAALDDKTKFVNDFARFQTDAAIQPGNSGGPIFDLKGNVVGVVVSKYIDLENVAYGIMASIIKNLISSHDVSLEKPNVSDVNAREFSDSMSKGTVLLTCWLQKSLLEKLQKENKGKVSYFEITD